MKMGGIISYHFVFVHHIHSVVDLLTCYLRQKARITNMAQHIGNKRHEIDLLLLLYPRKN